MYKRQASSLDINLTEGLSAQDVTDASVATGLGILGMIMWISVFSSIFVVFMRAGSLQILAAVTPLTWAGFVTERGGVWFGRSLRWFLSAAFTPAMMLLIMGIGVQISSTVAEGTQEEHTKTLISAGIAVIIVAMSLFSPLFLLKMFAFADPTTASAVSYTHLTLPTKRIV